MQINLKKILGGTFFIIFGWLAAISFAWACPQNDPVNLLQCIADNMIAGLKSNKATLRSNPQVVYSLANRFVVPYADLEAMSQRVLPPQIWRSASQAERDQFKAAFKTTLIRTYASALTSYQDQVVKLYPPRGNTDGRTVVVNSVITGSGSSINVSYRLTRTSSGWKLFDMTVEGVSMLESFRAQFADILSQGNMKQLLQRLSTHNTGRR